MMSFFENLTKAFPESPPEQPPKDFIAFCRYYSAGMWKVLISVSVIGAVVAILEVSLFGYMGQLVDWFATRDKATFISEEMNSLIWMGLVVMVFLPVLVILQSALTHQSLLGNFPMRIRWQAHRYLLGQSLSFYQDEFAGRVATKVMQTALSVRETVMKIMNLAVYICVYFILYNILYCIISIIVLVFSTDWRLSVPLIIWLVVYVVILRALLPKLKAVSQKQADARSIMTGRIIDSYTNIMTVKLISHNKREEDYAREGMDGFLQTVYPQMRLVTVLQACVWASNSLLVFSVSALAIYLWVNGAVSPGDIAIAVSLSLRLNGMSQWIMWEVSSLFENIGTVQDGINTLAMPATIEDKNNAPVLNINGGGIEFKDVNFAYVAKNNTEIKVLDDLNISIRKGEKVGLVGRSGAGKSTLVNLLLRFYDIQSGKISIDGQGITDVTQESLRRHISMVTQDTSLMHRSVRDNIIYGRTDATDE
ncbi:MAG: ABC transporter ATP-binding protein, partial [Glaciecola sp.]